MPVRNLMEDIVDKALKEMVAKPEYSGLLPAQMDDILAMVLNKLPPRYTTTAKGEAIVKSQVRHQLESDVYRELAEAINIVTRSPR